jgi:hypothetical protein
MYFRRFRDVFFGSRRCFPHEGDPCSGAKRFFRETARKAEQPGYVAEMRFDAGFADGEALDSASG